MRKIILLLSILIIPSIVYGQPNTPCSTAAYNPVVSNAAGTTLYICTTGGTWLALPVTPPGSIVMITSGTCSAGWTEDTTLSGVTLVGTLAANGNVGTTGGSDNITPAGTNSALTFTGSSASTNAVTAGTPSGSINALSFTGSAWSAPAVTWPASVPTNANESAHTHSVTAAGTNGATATSGNCAATNLAIGTGAATACKATAPNLTVPAEIFSGSAVTSGAGSAHTHVVSWPVSVPTIGAYTPAGSITSPTFTGSALGTHSHTVTATGTINTPIFTGTQFDNRSSFKYVIFCKKS
jgi:hypothetical protein